MNCVVFDIDGTLADGSHREGLLKQNPKPWDVYFSLLSEDTLIIPVAQVCRGLHDGGMTIIYCTGRPAKYIPQTHQWLRDNILPTMPIYHRKDLDFRDDTIIKLELLEEIKTDGYNPIIIFDDRNRVVLSLRRAGYTVAQVREGDF